MIHVGTKEKAPMIEEKRSDNRLSDIICQTHLPITAKTH